MDRENKGYITAEDYTRHFTLTSNAQKHARNVFETLDKEGKGRLTLLDFIKVNVPKATPKELAIIEKWMDSFSEDMEDKFLKMKVKEEESKKILPRQMVNDFLRIYDHFDTENSGMMTIKDMRTMLAGAYNTDSQIDDFFKKKGINTARNRVPVDTFLYSLQPEDCVYSSATVEKVKD